ncbi:hypothetical protein J7J00_17845 [Bacillus sp. ISL-4]|uniref:hypothetical protein n=1 Tax=Bacillus sp. ISL-4 TaxID=2819125 RepID=UPI001BE5F86D|nr:hypothetical protein [Bacillus sp. ISL-4]MBT2667343.1 hypothetical protein [Bacillus sp. ISL-4]MBT2669421.1 hypothetical protein [Streptomyces sp. ISL-14]
MKASHVIVILFSVFLCLTGCQKYEVSSLDKEALEKVSKQYLHSDEATEEGQIRPEIDSLYSIPNTNRKIVLFRTENKISCNKCYGFTQIKNKGQNKYEFMGGADISNDPLTEGFIEIDNKTFCVMVVDNKSEKINKVVIKQKGVFSHTFKPKKNLSVSLKEVDKKTYNNFNSLDLEIIFYDKNNKNITKLVKKEFPNDTWVGIGG